MFKTNDLIRNAIIAALYAALTLSLAPLSYGPIQVRVSEFMTLLAFTNRKCMPGLVLGCFLANIGSPYGVTDMVIGTLATFLAVYAMQFCPNLFTASLMPVIFNGFAASNCFATFPGPQPTSNTSASGARSLASSWNMRHIRRIFHELAGIRLRIGVVRLNCCVCFVHAFGSFTHSLIRAYSRESTVRPDVFILSYCRNLLPIQRPTTSTAVWQNCRMQKDFSAISRSN